MRYKNNKRKWFKLEWLKFTGLLFTNDYVMGRKAKPPITERQGKDWRDIKWYEWIYEINELWQIRSYWKIGNRENSIVDYPIRYVKMSWYCSHKWAPMRATVMLYNWTINKKYRVARLMAKAFLWMSDAQYNDRRVEVIHLNWDQMDCRLENLKVTNPSERMINYFKNKAK